MKAQRMTQNTQDHNDLAHARRVLSEEASALTQMANTLDGSFVDAVDMIEAMKEKPGHPGRLIIAGIGKSGHIARKIAATMASTGTPSYFIHPGEASHGDLGMVTDNDVVIMLSNSGENKELSDLIHYTRRYDIGLIAITGNADSTMAKYADIALVYPKLPEACPNGLAPTTSTTMMIAMGDALSVSLLERSGLTSEQFKKFHPGGKLGDRLQKVSDLMHKMDDLPLVKENTTMDQAILIMTEKNLGCVLIVDNSNTLKGIITDGDLKRFMRSGLLEMSVNDIMSANPKSIHADALAVEALKAMTKKDGAYLTSLVVKDENNALTGLVRLQDCLKAGAA